MHVFIGGTASGKRQRVAERYPEARWRDADEMMRRVPGAGVGPSPGAGAGPAIDDGDTVVISGWLAWLEAELGAGRENERENESASADDDRLGQRWRQAFTGWASSPGRRVLVLDEVGRGIVPVDPAQRRLRDLMGWLSQDAVRLASQVHYVRHGLTMRLDGKDAAAAGRAD
ncbi:adenosylcobinamide kinase [Halomonas litopenaei]|uniref:Adenosylcobinamide kinase n=1 Tax=Halomonas litopenaei TaxID=2109328 RepID=A0ABX5IUW2_9GAMM|nr:MULTISPECIES: bifunctional adenosylcobinamide kinase/adenosylcobinamide-phosphate guanylyltransferase [Halomonas]PTL90877.1 adenosylcobinamide kinase [Halomonas sp. SYSU XM8]PTL93533.1 adenosylcobinamide kinase [Halomonas litopenaei]